MATIDDKLQALNTKIKGKADDAERAVRQQMELFQKEIDGRNAAAEAAKSKVNEWMQIQKTAALSKIAEWKAKGDAKNLQARADLADEYAAAMSVIAIAAVENAAKASLQALLAHYDAAASKLARAVR
jgi:hypothetical protein